MAEHDEAGCKVSPFKMGSAAIGRKRPQAMCRGRGGKWMDLTSSSSSSAFSTASAASMPVFMAV